MLRMGAKTAMEAKFARVSRWWRASIRRWSRSQWRGTRAGTKVLRGFQQSALLLKEKKSRPNKYKLPKTLRIIQLAINFVDKLARKVGMKRMGALTAM